MAERLKLSRARRLTQQSEFAHVRERGRAFRGECMTLAVAEAPKNGAARLGVITSRRVGNAVARNRVRRRLRELFRTNQPRIRSGVWIVTIARAAATSVSYAALQAEWLRLARRASILRD